MLGFTPYLNALSGHIINYLVDLRYINSINCVNHIAHNSPYILGQTN